MPTSDILNNTDETMLNCFARLLIQRCTPAELAAICAYADCVVGHLPVLNPAVGLRLVAFYSVIHGFNMIGAYTRHLTPEHASRFEDRLALRVARAERRD
jgi:hypothetical protein